MKDKCILCGNETQYEQSTHIDMRVGYIEGAGQLCDGCYNEGTNRKHIAIPENMIRSTPNDAELGALVRKAWYETSGGGQ